MTEDRLTRLLNEATDLAPSALLRARIESDLRAPTEALRARMTPWFVLSGAIAAVAVVGFLALPRSASAAELLKRADQAVRANLTYRIERDVLIQGRWHLDASVLHAPGWRLEDWPDGSFRLERPGVLYRRNGSGTILMTHRFRPKPEQVRLEDDPSPESYIRFILDQQGRLNPGLSKAAIADTVGKIREEKGRHLTESGRSLQEVVVTQILFPDRRTRFLIDEVTSLPARIETDLRRGGQWQAEWRNRFTYPGPAAGSEAFRRPLRSGKIVDVDARGSKIAIG